MTTEQKSINSKILGATLHHPAEMQKYWAAYINMARNNLFSTLKFIRDSVGISGEDKEEYIPKMSIINTTLSPEAEMKARSLFFTHFPFLKYQTTQEKDNEYEDNAVISFETLRGIIRDFAYSLNFYRNKFSHSIHKDIRPQNIVAQQQKAEFRSSKCLQGLLTVSTRIIRERYRANRNAAQQGMLDESSLKFLTEGKVKKSRDNGLVQDTNFYLYTFDHANHKLNEFGLLLLTTLFLKKKYATELLTQCGFLDAFDSTSQAPRLSQRRLMLEVMTALRIRLPEKRLSIEKEETQITLDILNELKKCPAEIYELLEDSDRSKFNVIAETGENVLLKRHSDRFPQLALSWLDATKAFDKLRFQVNAGKIRYLFKEQKYCIDGQTRARVLEEPLNAFRRLDEFEAERIDRRAGDSPDTALWPGYRIINPDEVPRNDSSILPFITDSRARYIFDGNNIGISVGDYTPEIREDGRRLKVACKTPDGIISKYELPAMMFYHLLSLKYDSRHEKLPTAEKIILGCIDSFRKMFSDIRDGVLEPFPEASSDTVSTFVKEKYGIEFHDIPEALQNYLLCSETSSDFARWKERRIKELIDETKARQQRLKMTTERVLMTDKNGRSENKPGKRGFVSIKPGTLASFIAEDIVMFQEGGATEKLTGLNFTVLQSRLATFSPAGEGTSRELLLQTFRNAGFISQADRMGSHPFLHLVMQQHPRGIVELYRFYLAERLNYLTAEITDYAAFLHSGRKKWKTRTSDYYRELAGRYLDRAVILPRQLFEKPIFEMLKQISGANAKNLMEELSGPGAHFNSTYMIMEYFYWVMDDAPQRFYGISEGDMYHDNGYKFRTLIRKNLNAAKKMLNTLGKAGKHKERYYSALEGEIRLAEKCKSHTENVGMSPADYDKFASSLKKAYNEMCDTEKTLRRYAVQDEVLYMAALQSLRNILELKKYNSLLCDVSPEGNNILDSTLPSIITKAYNKAKPGSISIEQNNVKLKDYGNVFKLLSDTRTETLLTGQKGIVKATDLSEELDKYDASRIDAFSDILSYEKKIAAGHTESEMLNENGIISFSKIQTLDTQNSDVDKQKIRSIRNAFAHNQYPEKEHKGVSIYTGDIPGVAKEMSDTIDRIEKETK